MFRMLLHHVLLGRFGMSTIGVPLTIDGLPELLFVDLTANLTDGDGHRMTYDWKVLQVSSLASDTRMF